MVASKGFYEILDAELCQWQTMNPPRGMVFAGSDALAYGDSRTYLNRLPLDHRFQSFKRRLGAAIARRGV